LEQFNSVEIVQENENLTKIHKKRGSVGMDDEFVEEIIESEDENR